MSRHLINHEHLCPGCGEIHVIVMDAAPILKDLAAIKTELRRMGRHMATATEQLTALTAKVDDLIADVRAALAVIGGDELSPEAQASLDAINAKVDAFDAEVGDADGSDTQPV